MTPSPFKTIWLQPRVTLRRILETPSTRFVFILASLAGLNAALDEASNRNLGDEFAFGTLLIGTLLIGPIVGVVTIWIFTFVLKLAGYLIEGKGNLVRIANAVAWSSLPSLIGLVFWIPQILIFGSEMFESEMPTAEKHPQLATMIVGLDAISVLFSFWGLGMLCFMLAEAQGFASVWRGVLNLIIAAAIIICTTFLLGFLGISF